MKETDKKQFTQMLKITFDSYMQQMSVENLDTYWQLLKSYELQEVRKALQEHISSDNGKFLPRPVDILRLMQNCADEANDAWQKVFKTLSLVGSGAQIVFDDRNIVPTILSIGGWQRLCNMTNYETQKIRDEFCVAYQRYKKYTHSEEVKKIGSGSELVLVHGSAHDYKKTSFESMEKLINRLELIRCDLRGDGSTPVGVGYLGVDR